MNDTRQGLYHMKKCMGCLVELDRRGCCVNPICPINGCQTIEKEGSLT